jgi:hypothetical protein
MLPGNELICKFTERNNIRHQSGRYGVLQSPLKPLQETYECSNAYALHLHVLLIITCIPNYALKNSRVVLKMPGLTYMLEKSVLKE